MANDWLRLWHDMPTDPKFRVVAKASNQPLHLVIALYVALLVDASKNNMSRGVTKCHDEDLAVTLDCDMSQIAEIRAAMQGRLLDGNRLTGWEARQPKREDQGNPETGAKSAAERKAMQRERAKQQHDNSTNTGSHDESRKVTLDTDKEVNLLDAPQAAGDQSPSAPATPENQECNSADGGQSPSRKRGTRLPEDWVLPKAWGEWALANRPGWGPEDVRLCADKFADYWRPKSGSGATKLDWLGTWRNWVRNDRTAPAGGSARPASSNSIFAGMI
jgi:hypothetical protein